MKSEQLERITNSSIKDVELLANLRSSMCENDFYLMAHQEFSKYIQNPKVVSMIINTSNNTYELSRLLQMKDRDWYSGAILYFCNIFREAMQSNKAAVVSIVEGEYASIHASLENYHDSYFLQNQHMSDNPRHIVRAYFRMMGDTIESVHYPHIQFIYKIMTIAPSSPLYGRPIKVSNGKAVSELTELNYFKAPFKDFLNGVSLNQWRNISNHSSYKYKANLIHCEHSSGDSFTLSLKELENTMVNLDILQAMLKTSIEFPILEFIDELDLLHNLEISEEAIFSQLGNSISLHGYKFKGIKKNNTNWTIMVEDLKDRDPDTFVNDSQAFLHPLLMLKHNGIDGEIEFFNATGKSLKKLLIKIGKK